MSWLLGLGILLRLAVLIVAEPDNPDFHIDVIQYVAEQHALPVSNLLNQSYHPPLYYVLMAPLWAAFQSKGPIHFVSFVFSCINLLMIRRLLLRQEVMRDPSVRAVAFALACFMPEYVMFSGFISNDAITLPLGTLLFLCTLRYIQEPGIRRLVTLAGVVGVCLLTKGTFLATGFALAVLVAIVEARGGWKPAISRVMLFCVVWSILGCYKYVDNTIRLGRPIVHNLESPATDQYVKRGAYKGLHTIYDINVIKLIREPILHPANTFSYPLLMYGTFWYPHVPESSLRASIHGYHWVGSITYAIAVVPTLIFLAGLGRAISLGIGVFRVPRGHWQAQSIGLLALAAMLMLFSNLAIVLAAGIKFDIWWCFQSRLCFQSMMPILFIFGLGMEPIPRNTWVRVPILSLCWLTAACGVLYFLVELAFAYNLLPVGPEMLP